MKIKNIYGIEYISARYAVDMPASVTIKQYLPFSTTNYFSKTQPRRGCVVADESRLVDFIITLKSAKKAQKRQKDIAQEKSSSDNDNNHMRLRLGYYYI